jgi:hypothetical protein
MICRSVVLKYDCRLTISPRGIFASGKPESRANAAQA